MRRIVPNLLLALGALLVTFLVLEVAVRLFVDFRLQQPTAIYDVDQSTMLHFLPGKTRVYETHEFTFTTTFNRFGRRDVEWSDGTVANPGNILFLGDSLVFGNGVEHEQTMPSQLEAVAEELGQSVEVFNFGMPAGAPPGYKYLLEDAIQDGFGARTIIAGIFVGNDFYKSSLTTWPPPPEHVREAAAQQKPRSLLPSSRLLQYLRLRVSQSTRMVGWALTVGRWLGISIYDTAGTYVFLREPTPEQRDVFYEILGYFGQMKKICDATGRKLYGVVIPNRIQVENGKLLTNSIYDAKLPNKRIMEYCEEIGVPCLDLLPPFERAHARSDERLYYPIDRHLTPHGNRVAAERIYEFLVKSGATFGR